MHLADRLTSNDLVSKPLFPREGVEQFRSQSLSKMDPGGNEVLFCICRIRGNYYQLRKQIVAISTSFSPSRQSFPLLDFGVLKKDSA